jgi:hypothetical protein
MVTSERGGEGVRGGVAGAAGYLGEAEIARAQVVGTQTDTEYCPTWLKGDVGIERPGVNRVEFEAIDEAHYGGDRVGSLQKANACDLALALEFHERLSRCWRRRSRRGTPTTWWRLP